MADSYPAEVERALLLIAHARERAERTARTIRREGGDRRLVDALESADRALLAVHGELMRSTYFGPREARTQLELDSAA